MSGRVPGARTRALIDGRNGPIHVIGAGSAEGSTLLCWLAAHGVDDVIGHDFAVDERDFARAFRRANPALDREAQAGTLRAIRRFPLRLGGDYLRGIEGAGLVLASQNWFNYPPNRPLFGLEGKMAGLVDLALDLFPGTRIGVTGSNGKSTTSALLRELLAARPGRVLHGGNDRLAQAGLGAVESACPDDVLVWEISNRHLRDRTVPVDIAVLTNITRNHVEDHGSFEAYVEAKLRLPCGASVAVVDADDPVTAAALPRIRSNGARVWMAMVAGGDGAKGADVSRPGAGLDETRAWIDHDRVLVGRGAETTDLGDAARFGPPGPHNQKNLLLAVLAALAAGAPSAGLEARWAAFGGLPGRLETVHEEREVRWIYDIQATTAPAAAAGVRAVGRPVVLLVGGDDKGMDWTGLAEACRRHARAVLLLPGTASERLDGALAGDVRRERAADLDAAIERARDLAQPGDAVLLSPGGAFFQSRLIEPGPPFAERVRAGVRT